MYHHLRVFCIIIIIIRLPSQHTIATHPAPLPTHYHTPPATQYLTTHQTTVPLHPNPPPLHSIPYTTIPSSTPARTPNTLSYFSPHRHPTPYTLIPRMGTSERHKGAQLRMTIIFFMESDPQWTTTIGQHDGGDESNSSFLGQTNLYSIISCNIQGLNTEKQKHKVQLISELAK